MVDFNEILSSLLSSPIPKHKRSYSEFSQPVLTKQKKTTDDLYSLSKKKFGLSPKQIKALHSSLTLKILRVTELLYLRKKAKELLVFNPDSKKSFWDYLGKELYGFMCQALEFVSERTDHLPKMLQMSLLTYQTNTLTENRDKIMDGIFFTFHLHELNKRHNCFFLRKFDQKTHPQFSLHGPQCVGVLFDWAYQLWTHPPTTVGTPSKKMNAYLDFVSTLTREEFPTAFLAQDTFLGEPCLDKNTLFFQAQRSMLLDMAGPPAMDSCKFDGNLLMAGAQQLFEKKAKKRKNPQVSIIEATLISRDTPHMIGIARIDFNHSTAYRFIDSDVGEFEARCPKQLGNWLQHYFQLFGYTQRFQGFTLRMIDPALAKLSQVMAGSDTIFDKRKKPLNKTQTLALKPNPPVMIAYKKFRQKSATFARTMDNETTLGKIGAFPVAGVSNIAQIQSQHSSLNALISPLRLVRSASAPALRERDPITPQVAAGDLPPPPPAPAPEPADNVVLSGTLVSNTTASFLNEKESSVLKNKGSKFK